MAKNDHMVEALHTFSETPAGLFRWPPNIESLTVDPDRVNIWVTARRNDVSIRLPLTPDDARHLGRLLTAAADRLSQNQP